MAGRINGTYRVADSDALADGGRLVVDVGDLTIGIFRIDGALYAYESTCAHQGGPVCQGKMMPRVVEYLDSDATTQQAFDESRMDIVCPWHGYEYDIVTGHHAGVEQIRLTPVVVGEADGGIHVHLDR